ncbi:unnamed protein product [Chilo suppressalis]|uniref:Seminal fluid protein n=1 Tax=Chilo suppressalis TaxID=168631 RepID=A0ABN8BG75_CHISP|nr:unnamed protein product [Chilo suppressalis]
MDKVILYMVFICVTNARGISIQKQLDHIISTRRENLGRVSTSKVLPSRRSMEYNAILGAPSLASHLPEAESILPGHTLLRPALGMLKSSIKFPHKHLNDGAGVYGNYENIGIRYDGRQKRVLYSGFRRALSDYLMVVPVYSNSKKPEFVVTSAVLDLDKEHSTKHKIMQLYKSLKSTDNNKKKRKKIIQKPSYLNMMEQLAKSNTRKYKENKKPILRTLPEINNSDGEEGYFSDNNYKNSAEKRRPNEKHPKNSEENMEKPDKTTMLWQTKNAFNHVKISPDALNHEDLLPAKFKQLKHLDDDIRNWWFFHQDDYEPFTDEKDR